MTPPVDRLEPEVRDMAHTLFALAKAGVEMDGVEALSAAILSAAISLKRIADAVAPTDGTDLASALYYMTQALERR